MADPSLSENTIESFIYLHGLASSPLSTKAQYFDERFRERDVPLVVLDGNQGGFSTLTLTRMIEQVFTALVPDRPTTVIGSSFGGLAAAWAAEKFPQIHRLVLLAPAFEFRDRWLARLGETQIQQWQTTGSMPLYHYGEQRSLALNYRFVEDLSTYSEVQLQRQLPTMILHGKQDDVIGIESSRRYAAHRPWVQLIEMDSDHALTNVLPQLWQVVQNFCF
jgi:hypothetical protein